MKTISQLIGHEKPDNMSQEQWLYAVALAAYETTQDNIRTDIAALPLAHIDHKEMTDAQWNELFTQIEAIEEKRHKKAHQKNLRDAEDLMIDAVAKTTKQQFGLSKWRQIEKAFVDGRKNPIHREKLVDICFKAPAGSMA